MDPLLNQRPGWTATYLQQTSISSDIPFWFSANRGGVFPDDSRNNTLFMLQYRQAKRDLLPGVTYEWAGAATAIFSSSRSFIKKNHAFFADELYVRLQGFQFRLQIGKYHEKMGMGAPYFSTGRMMLSTNAVPAWKVSLDTPGFINVPYLSGYVAFKGRWSEEVTTDDRYVDGAAVHRKYLYINVRPVPELNLIGGIVHNLMYGGTHPKLGKTHNFSNYWSDILGRPYEESNTPLGNTVAAYDFALKIHTDNWTLAGSRLFYLEDKVSANFRSTWDGLWAGWFELHKKDRLTLVDYIMYEHINTRRQDALDFDLRGRAKYGMHGVYRAGYTHHARFFGTSLFGYAPIEINENNTPITNNILIAHHAGVKGDLTETIKWAAKATYSRNYGFCADQLPAEITRQTCYHVDYGGINLREMDGHTPLRDLRQDRYSLWFALVKHWLATSSGAEAGKTADMSKADAAKLNTAETDSVNKTHVSATPWSYSLKVAVAADWGEYVGKRRIGAEITFQIYF